MNERVIEGTWDDVVKRNDLRGRRVRITVIDEPASQYPQSPESGDTWLAQLRA